MISDFFTVETRLSFSLLSSALVSWLIGVFSFFCFDFPVMSLESALLNDPSEEFSFTPFKAPSFQSDSYGDFSIFWGLGCVFIFHISASPNGGSTSTSLKVPPIWVWPSIAFIPSFCSIKIYKAWVSFSWSAHSSSYSIENFYCFSKALILNYSNSWSIFCLSSSLIFSSCSFSFTFSCKSSISLFLLWISMSFWWFCSLRSFNQWFNASISSFHYFITFLFSEISLFKLWISSSFYTFSYFKLSICNFSSFSAYEN